jgi:hypothetical protein
MTKDLGFNYARAPESCIIIPAYPGVLPVCMRWSDSVTWPDRMAAASSIAVK